MTLQFECESGRIILGIDNHDCTKGYSTNFLGITSSIEFVAKWSEFKESEGVNMSYSPSPSRGKPTSSSTCTQSVVTPKRSRVAIASQGALTYDQLSPSKKRRYMTDALDEAIERGKKGKNLCSANSLDMNELHFSYYKIHYAVLHRCNGAHDFSTVSATQGNTASS